MSSPAPALAGLRPLFAATARQEMRRVAPWVVLLSALSVTSVLAYSWVFPDALSRAVLARGAAANPAFGLIFGSPTHLSTAEGFNDWRALPLGDFLAGLMTTLLVVRHTRGDEDSGQAELVASGALSRHTRLAVALALAGVASLALGVLCTVTTALVGSQLWPALALSATYAATGLMFAGVAALTAQVVSDAHTAATVSIGILGASFLLRGYLTASDSPWLPLSPLGWTQLVEPAGARSWWWLIPCLALAAGTTLAAHVVLARRDFGMGLLPPSAGRAVWRGRAPLVALARRWHGPSIATWTVAFLVLGSVFGFLATTLSQVFATNLDVTFAIAAGAASHASLTSAFIVMQLRLLGIVAAVFGVQIVLRLLTEEFEHRVDPILAGGIPRARLLAVTVTAALAGPALALLGGSAVAGFVAHRALATVAVGDVIRQAAAELPAVALLVAAAVFVAGIRPVARAAAWVPVIATFALTILGPLFNLPDWVLGFSPFWHVPTVTEAGAGWVGLGVVGVLTIALVIGGFVGYRRRDLW